MTIIGLSWKVLQNEMVRARILRTIRGKHISWYEQKEKHSEKWNKIHTLLWAHNKSLLVKEGDSVKQGQKIATLGKSSASEPKLHFEVRKQGKPVNPLRYLTE